MDKLLNDFFGIPSFRDKQEEAILSVIDGHNTLCLMPTGMGKSLIYQYAAVRMKKTALIFSPLLALMDQQRDNLNSILSKKGYHALSFNSNFDSKKQLKYLSKQFNPPYDPAFLFISPEKAMLDGYLAHTLTAHKEDIGLIVIDEAHCVSQWGHSFRPAYKLIPNFIKTVFGDTPPPVLCLTATINQQDREEIKKDFSLNNEVVSESLYRHNIKLNILNQQARNQDKKEQLESILKDTAGERVIVYTHIKKRDYGTRAMSEYFASKGFNCAPFDADLSEDDRVETLNGFIKGDIAIIFATTAFGMGIDIPDIRCVVHYLLPESLEQYYQEVGRAGRDGKNSYAYLLHAEPNLRIKRDLIEKGEWSEEAITSGLKQLLGKKGQGDLPYIGQLDSLDYGEGNINLIVLLKLVELGLASIESRGFSDIRCFKEIEQDSRFTKLQEVSRTGSVKLIARRTEKTISQVQEDIYGLLASGSIKVNKSPQKVLFYTIHRPLNEMTIERIKVDFDQIVAYKLQGLENLNEVLNGDETIDNALKQKLGISKN